MHVSFPCEWEALVTIQFSRCYEWKLSAAKMWKAVRDLKDPKEQWYANML